VWSGFDYLGEPTPYYNARSSYSGIIDLAGFPKDRFYLYQSRWRPDLPMVHILPHWNWPERIGKTTPVHVFTSGDEAELFLNGRSLGRKKKAQYEYRLRWDDVVYQPGQLKVIAYKQGKIWSAASLATTGAPAKLKITSDKKRIAADGKDLVFLTVMVVDKNGAIVPTAGNLINYSVEGPGEIVATDNGDPASLVSFASAQRNAYAGMVLGIIRAVKGSKGSIRIKLSSDGIASAMVELVAY
jgi:beta-galactosidase